MKIPITKPIFDDSENKAVAEALKSGWVVQGPKVAEFERLFSGFTGAAHSVAVTSCTTALHLALIAAGVKPGDEVIVPAFTFVATANAVEYMGARPVFCDVEIDTFNIDTIRLRERITKKTKAIVPVHLFGLCADMDEINAIAKENGLMVIEDAACAFGSTYKDRHAGTLSFAGCFSFHPRKAITTGEGGMITINDGGVEALLRSLRDHGASKSDMERHNKKGSLLPDFNMLGYNYRMTDIQGAIGVEQMKKSAGILKDRKKIAALYDEALKELDWLAAPSANDGYGHSYQSYACLVRKGCFGGSIEKANEFRNILMDRLENLGIATRQGTHAAHTLGYYKSKYGLKDADFPSAYEADRLSIALPLYAGMKEEEFTYVIENLRKESKGLL